MSVALLNRVGRDVVVSHMDVRGGKSVEAVADEIKARCSGMMLIEWWAQARDDWFVNFRPSPIHPAATRIDIRRALLRSLSQGLRVSPTGKWLKVRSEDGASVVLQGAEENAGAIGRDVLAWWEGPRGSQVIRVPMHPRTVDYDLRIGLNQAMQNYQVKRDRAARVGR